MKQTIGWQDLANKYLQEESQTLDVWDRKTELCSDSEIKLLNTPELVKLYISKYELCSDSEIELLNTPELVKLYISKYGVSESIKDIIKEMNKKENTF